ncbi:MAG: META domain-containing protein [Bryobacteraceae bacterium]
MPALLLSTLLLMLQVPQSSKLEGSRWLLQDLGGKAVLDNARATLEFLNPGRVSGRGSCNRISGPVTIEGSKIHFGPLISTRMACSPAVNEQEANYLKALESAEKFKVTGAALFIYCKDLPQPLRFTPM